MSNKTETAASVEATLKAGMDQWQSATETWNRVAVGAFEANLATANALREQLGAALVENAKRANAIAAREQAQALESFEAMQAVARESFERLAAAGRTATTTGRALFDEAVKLAEEQAKVAQAQVRVAQERAAEWADQGIEAVTNAPKTARK